MTSRRVVAIGGDASFRPQLAHALLMSPDALSWLPSVDEARRTLANVADRIELVVLGPTVSDEETVEVAQRLAKESPSTAVVSVRQGSVDGAFPTLVRAGVRDLVDLSKGDGELEDALRRALEWSTGVRTGRTPPSETDDRRGIVISVFSTKGGTGKTFLACNLAAALGTMVGRVAILDLDHDLGDVFGFFNAEPRRSLHDLAVLEEGADSKAVAELGTPLEGRVVGFGSLPDPRAEPITGGSVGKIVRSLQDAFAFVVVDASADYSDHVLAALDLSDVVCLITGLDVIGIRHMSLGLQTLERLGIPRDRLRIVLNRADSKVDLGPAEIERALDVKVDARIPSSALVPRSINHGRLLWFEEPRSDVAKSIAALAESLQLEFAPQLSPTGDHRRRLLRRS